MLERRPLFGLLIGLTVCVSIWRISLQEPSMVATEVSYTNQFQPQIYHQQHQPQPQQQISLTSSSWTSSSAAASSLAVINNSPGANSGEWKNNFPNGNINRNSPNITTLIHFSYNNSRSNNFSSKISNFNLSLVSLASSAINYDTLPKDDLSSLIDLHDFEFIMNQMPCGRLSSNAYDGIGSHSSSSNRESSNPFVLILVHSAPANYKKRLLIRETWGSLDDESTRLIFLLGAVNSTEDQQSLELENGMFSDMVQGNFIDAYRNMTYKHVMALKWFSYYCPEAKFILKIDDDVFVNTPYLLKYLNMTAVRQDLLFCQKVYGARVKRSYRSKWRVSTREYPGRYYPPYCPGYSIVYSPDVAFRLYVEAQKTPYFWIDDVHVTGTLSQQANITISSFISFILNKSDCEEILAGKTDINSFVFLFTWPDIKENQTRSLWNLIRDIR